MVDLELTFSSFSLIRTMLMLGLACLYLMWMIAYMAQLHPLIGMCNGSMEGRSVVELRYVRSAD